MQLRQVGGNLFVASLSFVYTSTGRPLTTGSIGCRARVGANLLKVVTRTFSGTSTLCAWRVPAWAHSRKIGGGVAVRMGDAVVSHGFVHTVD